MKRLSQLALGGAPYRKCLFLLFFCGLTAQHLGSQTVTNADPGTDVLAPGTLETLSGELATDIKGGDAELAQIHAMQLQTVIGANMIHDSGGTTSVDFQALFSKLTKVKPSRTIGVDPAATAPLIEATSRLQAAITKPDWSDAGKQVAALLHALTKVVKDKMDINVAESLRSSSDQVFSEYLRASFKLRDALRSGDVAAAEALAPGVLLETQRRGGIQSGSSLESENLYYVYDALGRSALQRNDFDAAQKDLILSATTVGGPHLDTWGPNLTLAKALLDLGYKETVVAFLTSCKAFWPNPKVDGWISQIRQGQTPTLSPLY